MKRTIKYTAPTSVKELKDFQKLNYHIEDEEWKSIFVDGFEKFKISTYGRLFNTKTKNLRSCITTNNQVTTCDINSITYVILKKVNGKDKTIGETVCDLMLHTFFPEDANHYVNPIPKDGNIYNLSFGDNIRFVPNAYYKGSDEYREEWIYIDGEKTKYTINTNGVIINKDRGNKVKTYNRKTNLHKVSISHNGIVLSKSVKRLMAETFIPNPNNLTYAASIDLSKTEHSLDNICWTDRYRLVKK